MYNFLFNSQRWIILLSLDFSFFHMSQKFLLSLADLPQESRGIIPLELITQWTESERTAEIHQALLSPYIVSGTMVCSDAAGLSKLSQRVTLLEAMKLVSEPKESIFAYGRKIGGRALGTWAADNTQMFYEKDIPVELIVEQMIGAQKDIQDLTVQVGIGIHCGEFIQLGETLFGDDAFFIEEFTENYTRGGEIVVSASVASELSPAKRASLHLSTGHPFAASIYSLKYAALPVAAQKGSDTNYPIPFDKDFYEYLRMYPLEELSTHEEEVKEHQKSKVVVLAKVTQKEQFFLLDMLTSWTISNAYMLHIAKEHHMETIKSNGNLGIFICDHADQAISFAKELCNHLGKEGYETTCGIAQGDVLLFTLESGAREIAGAAVNLASKIAEDSGEKGVLAHNSILTAHTAQKHFSFHISGIAIQGQSY